MWTIMLNDIRMFFTTLIAYIVIGVFLLFMGLMLFVFPDFSIFESGYATMAPFFDLAPNVLLFLIPAITMRSIAEEKLSGTLELLLSKPVTKSQLVLGKFLAGMFLVLIALLPTLIYFFSVYELGFPKGIIDTGATWASYFGLLLLSSSFVSIGIWASSLTDNQIVAFLIALFTGFILYYGFGFLSKLPVFFGKVDLLVEKIGMEYHYYALSRGVLDTRDIIYFLSIAFIFNLLTKMTLGYGQK
jgi:ABC-2 type transport system permease protein